MIEQIGFVNFELEKDCVWVWINDSSSESKLTPHDLTQIIKFCNKALIQIAKGEQ
jgi:hypothetical protein